MVVVKDQVNDGADSMNEDEDVRVEIDGHGDQNGIYEEAGEPAVPAAPKDPKQEKAEKKRMEKEEKKRKEEEKRQLKEQEKRFKASANGESTTDAGVTSRKQERDQKKQSGFSSFFSPLRPGVRPKNAMRGRVLLLDGSEIEVEIEKEAKAKVLVDKICDYVNIAEKDYFSCLYNDAREGKYWLIEDRRIMRQIGNGQWLFEFAVKFYPPEPTILQEDITRYQLCLQLRDDILSGRVPCSPVANALLGACTVQSELGDYDAAEHGVGIDYIQDIMFAPGQTDELLAKIAEMHRTQMRGRTPAEAELVYLENAKKLELYGIHLQQAKDIELFDILVGVSATGIHVYRDRLRVNRFPWPKVLKMSYKGKTFYIKIRPGECERFENTIGFKMLTHNLAKRFWRLAIEHHTFFRLKESSSVDRNVFARFGSSRSRYSGRTLYQSRIWSSTIDRVGPSFERTLSQRSLASRSLNNSSFMDRDDKRRTASMDRTGRRGYDDYQQDDGDDRQVAVVAGTAADANRVAYVKTVRPGSPSAEQHQQLDQTPREHYTNETFRYEPDDLSPLSTDVSQMQIGADGVAIPKRKKKKKKKKPTTNGSRQTSQRVSAEDDGTNFTETRYRTERDGVVETRVERRLVVNGQDIDHDYELSKAITNVTNMDADLSVEKIEINPSDVAKSMTGGEQTFAIAPVAGVKKKKKKASTKHREPVAQLA